MKKKFILWKWLVIGIIFLFVGTCLIPTTAQDTEKQSSRGSWLYVGGSGPGNYTHIQDAIDDANDGDTIIVYSGTYYEYVTVNKQLFLKGTKLNNQDNPLIYNRIITIYNDSCSFENFSVQNHKTLNGIQVLSDNNIIKNCTIYDCDTGIYLSSSCGNLFSNNEIKSGTRAFGLYSSCNNSIFNNNIYDHENEEILFTDNSNHNWFYGNYVHQCTHNPAVDIEQSPFNIIEENNISGNYEGLVIRSSPNTSVLRNSFWGDGVLFDASLQELYSYIVIDNLVDGKSLRYYVNQKGITVPADTGQVILINCSNFIIKNFTFIGAEHGIILFFSSNNSIKDNTISAGPAGILLYQSHDNCISRNMINGGRGAIYLSSSNNNIISNNTVQNQSKLPGIYLARSNNNKIIENVVINCRIGMAPQQYSEYNEFIRNTITHSSQWGVHLMGSYYNYFYKNNISDCSLGMLVDGTNGAIFDTNFISNCGAGIILKYGKSTEIMHNLILENDNGIDLLECSDVSIENNIIQNVILENNTGISLSACSNISIVNNNISHNKVGLIISSSGLITIKENNFIQNILDASFSVRFLQVLTNKFTGNYWGMPFLQRHIIHGTVYIVLFAVYYHEVSLQFPWFCVDWQPVQQPYNFGGK